MKSKNVTMLTEVELKNVMGGVAPGPNGEGCTERFPILIHMPGFPFGNGLPYIL